MAHLADNAQAHSVCETVLILVRHFLADAGVRLLPEDVAAGAVRSLRFRPGMGWVHTRA